MRFGTARDEDNEEGICVSAVFKVLWSMPGILEVLGKTC